MIREEFKKMIPLKLQFFAEGGEGTEGNTDTGAENSNGDSKEPGSEGNEGNNQGSDLDSFLKNPKNQSEFDKKITKALETARGKWESEAQKKIADAKTEAEKLAKMNADQKAEYERQKREGELLKREKDINTRELKAQAYETLASKNLPKELIETLSFEDAESCNKTMEAVEKAFQSAVEKVVNDRLRGNSAQKGHSGAGSNLQEQIAKAVRGQI